MCGPSWCGGSAASRHQSGCRPGSGRSASCSTPPLLGKPSGPVKLLSDLRDLGERDGQQAYFQRRLAQLREQHQRKPSFIARLDKVGLAVTAGV
jgi:hypothetical protein